MLTQKHKKALVTTSRKLNQAGLDWILIGTTSHNLQGVKVRPDDIDIVVDLKDLQKARSLFSNFKPTSITKIRSDHFKFKFKVVKKGIEIIGEKEAGKYFQHPREFITKKILANQKIFCRKLQKEIKLYKKLGRKEKAEKLKQFLRNKSLE